MLSLCNMHCFDETHGKASTASSHPCQRHVTAVCTQYTTVFPTTADNCLAFDVRGWVISCRQLNDLLTDQCSLVQSVYSTSCPLTNDHSHPAGSCTGQSCEGELSHSYPASPTFSVPSLYRSFSAIKRTGVDDRFERRLVTTSLLWVTVTSSECGIDVGRTVCC